MFGQHTFDQPQFFQPFKAVTDLMLVWSEQRPAPDQGHMNLHARKAAAPTERQLPDRAGHAAPFKNEVGNGNDS